AAEELSVELNRAYRGIEERERQRLEALAKRLDLEKNAEAARAVRAQTAQRKADDAVTRFVSLREVVAASGREKGLASVAAGGSWRGALQAVRSDAAREFFALANRAAKTVPWHYALADLCL